MELENGHTLQLNNNMEKLKMQDQLSMDQRKVHASWFQQLVTKTKIVDLMSLYSNSALMRKASNIRFPLRKQDLTQQKKGPYKWKIQKLAKEARKSCDVMVHAKFPDTKKLPTDSMASLNIISRTIEAAKMARFGSTGEKLLDTIFLDPYENSDKMTIANFDVFKKLFPRQNPKLEKNQAAYQPLVPRVLPNMYFCVCNNKCGKLIGKSDLETNAIIQDILKAIK